MTDRGSEFREVLVTFTAWGNRHFAPEGASVLPADLESGKPIDPIVVDRNSGKPIGDIAFGYLAGPAANERTRRRVAFSRGDISTDEYQRDITRSKAKASRKPRRKVP